jgi:hypothetical protein
MAVGESTKLLPWVMGGRKHVRAYLKVSRAIASLRAAARRVSVGKRSSGDEENETIRMT